MVILTARTSGSVSINAEGANTNASCRGTMATQRHRCLQVYYNLCSVRPISPAVHLATSASCRATPLRWQYMAGSLRQQRGSPSEPVAVVQVGEERAIRPDDLLLAPTPCLPVYPLAGTLVLSAQNCTAGERAIPATFWPRRASWGEYRGIFWPRSGPDDAKSLDF